jgi:hypothetical protein
MAASDTQSLIDTAVRVIEGLAVLCGGGFTIFKLGRVSQAFESAIKRQEEIATGQANEIGELRTEIKGLGAIMTDMAVQSQRLDNQGERMNAIEKRINDLAHGRGFIDVSIVRRE